MAKYRIKPVVIDAMQFTLNFDEIFDWVKQWHDDEKGAGMRELFDWLIIDTLEGEMEVRNGDWIIRGTKGEFYPCKPDIFEQIFELVTTPPAMQRKGD